MTTEHSERVKTIRALLQLEQKELAHSLGVALFTVSRWETGRSEPTGLQLEVLRALHQVVIKNENNPSKLNKISGMVGLGIGALIYRALSEGAERWA